MVLEEIENSRMHQSTKKELEKDVEETQTWIGMTEEEQLKRARKFMNRIEMLSEYCIQRKGKRFERYNQISP